MVLWEITVATAYFLGLKRTYRLALKLQRRLISPKHPKIRQFLHRRTRSVFDIAVSVHKKIQERDLEVGRNLGNWILCWLDRMKPSAQIRVGHPEKPPSINNTSRHTTSSSQPSGTQGSNVKVTDPDASRRLFTTQMNVQSKSFQAIGKMMQLPRPTGMSGHYRHHSYSPVLNFRKDGFEGVFRRDIAQWMLQN